MCACYVYYEEFGGYIGWVGEVVYEVGYVCV